MKRKWQQQWRDEWLREYYTLMPKGELEGRELWEAHLLGVDVGDSPALDAFERERGLVSVRRFRL